MFLGLSSEGWTAVFTGVLTLSTAALWWQTKRLAEGAEKQSDQTERSISLAADTARRQLRAYLSVEAVDIVAAATNGFILEPDQKIASGRRAAARVKVANGGETPAYDVRADIRMGLVGWPPKEADFAEIKLGVGSTSIMAPDGSHTNYAISTNALTDDEISKLHQAKSVAMFVWGLVTYTDCFKQSHFLKFRFFTGGPIGLREIAMSSDETGNEADR